MLPAFLRSARHVLAILLTVAAAGSAIGVTWYATERSIDARRRDAVRQADATVTGLAANYSELISRHILALDQTLTEMVRDWEADPRRFDLETERSRARVLTGISRDM